MIKSFWTIFVLTFLTFLPGTMAQEPNNNAGYDSTLAQKLGADEYGMRQYIMAFLKKGPNRSQNSAQRAEIQKAHLKNIMRLSAEGKLIVAGPFLDDAEVRGIFIFNVGTLEEARKLTESDPAVKAGVLLMELHPWYGPAILPEVLKLNRKLEKKSVVE